VWIACAGYPESPFRFPYVAQSPTTNKMVEFNSIEDVWNEIENRIDETRGSKFTEGNEIWSTLLLYANPNYLVDDESVFLIEDYNMCKRFNIPIASNLEDADADRIIGFKIIEEEIKAFQEFNSGR